MWNYFYVNHTFGISWSPDDLECFPVDSNFCVWLNIFWYMSFSLRASRRDFIMHFDRSFNLNQESNLNEISVKKQRIRSVMKNTCWIARLSGSRIAAFWRIGMAALISPFASKICNSNEIVWLHLISFINHCLCSRLHYRTYLALSKQRFDIFRLTS